MGFADVGQGIASVIFLVLFLALGLAVAFCIATRRPLRRFVGLSIFTAIRIGSQIAGIGFAYDRTLIAYFVLGAEGYFALCLSSLYILIAYQTEYFGSSWLYTPVKRSQVPNFFKRQRLVWRSPATWFHYALIPANVLTIYGGTSQNSNDGLTYSTNPNVKKGRILRAIGQALFLFLTMLGIAFVGATLRQAKKKGCNVRPLWFLLATMPFLLVRGIFGVMSSASSHWSYYNPANYDEDGLSGRILAAEYAMGLAEELITSILLLAAAWMLSTRKGHGKVDASRESDVEEGKPGVDQPMDRKQPVA